MNPFKIVHECVELFALSNCLIIADMGIYISTRWTWLGSWDLARCLELRSCAEHGRDQWIRSVPFLSALVSAAQCPCSTTGAKGTSPSSKGCLPCTLFGALSVVSLFLPRLQATDPFVPPPGHRSAVKALFRARLGNLGASPYPISYRAPRKINSNTRTLPDT